MPLVATRRFVSVLVRELLALYRVLLGHPDADLRECLVAVGWRNLDEARFLRHRLEVRVGDRVALFGDAKVRAEDEVRRKVGGLAFCGRCLRETGNARLAVR